MASAKAERVAGPPKFAEPVSGHADGTKVTRIQGPSAGAMADKVDPFVHLPITGAPDPQKQKDMIGKGGVTRQTGVLHQDSQGSLRVDIPEGTVDMPAGAGAVYADRRATPDEDQVSIVDPSMIHRPVVQGGLEKVGVVGFKGDKEYQAWLDKVKSGDPSLNASVQVDHAAQGVQLPELPPGAQSQIPADQRAAYAAGNVYASDRPALGSVAQPVRYSDLHDPKAGRAQAKAAQQAHADADRVTAGSRQRKAAPRKAKRRTASARSRQRPVARPAQPSATGGAPEDAEREKEAE